MGGPEFYKDVLVLHVCCRPFIFLRTAYCLLWLYLTLFYCYLLNGIGLFVLFSGLS